MTHRIPRREVLENLTHFKEALIESQGRFENGQVRRVYQALLNFRTGEILFAKRFRFLEPHLLPVQKPKSIADWKTVQVVVQESQGKIHFELFDSQGRPLNPPELTSLAWEVASETLETLNQKSLEVSSDWGEAFHEEAIVQDLFPSQTIAAAPSISDLPGWRGSIGRTDAEKLLRDQPPGTYLLREGDEITLCTVSQIGEENHFSIHPYLLTSVQEKKKVVEVLLLKTSRGWTCYQDDPDLDALMYQYYPSPQALINTLSSFASYPLY